MSHWYASSSFLFQTLHLGMPYSSRYPETAQVSLPWLLFLINCKLCCHHHKSNAFQLIWLEWIKMLFFLLTEEFSKTWASQAELAALKRFIPIDESWKTWLLIAEKLSVSLIRMNMTYHDLDDSEPSQTCYLNQSSYLLLIPATHLPNSVWWHPDYKHPACSLSMCFVLQYFPDPLPLN